MKQVASVKFRDLEEKCEGYAGTRVSDGVVAFVVSLEANGDVEIFVTPDEARAIAAALEAIS